MESHRYTHTYTHAPSFRGPLHEITNCALERNAKLEQEARYISHSTSKPDVFPIKFPPHTLLAVNGEPGVER